MKELVQRISEYEAEVKELIVQADAAAPSTPSASDHPADDDTDGSDDDTDDEFEDRFVDLEEDLANVIADVHDLGALSELLRRPRTDVSLGIGHFSHLNYTGFVKVSSIIPTDRRS